MAKKKVSTVDDALKVFKDTMSRALLTNYYHVDNIILSKNNNDNTILIVTDNDLWNKLIEDETWKKETKIRELDITIPEEYDLNKRVEYGRDLESDWLPIDMDSGLYDGKIFKIKINGYDYNITINRDLMPMKLKKAEYDGVSYRVFKSPSQILAIKKRFDNVVEGFGFTIIRLFKII